MEKYHNARNHLQRFQILERFKEAIHTHYRDVESMEAVIDILNTGMVLRWLAPLGEYNEDAREWCIENVVM